MPALQFPKSSNEPLNGGRPGEREVQGGKRADLPRFGRAICVLASSRYKRKKRSRSLDQLDRCSEERRRLWGDAVRSIGHISLPGFNTRFAARVVDVEETSMQFYLHALHTGALLHLST